MPGQILNKRCENQEKQNEYNGYLQNEKCRLFDVLFHDVTFEVI